MIPQLKLSTGSHYLLLGVLILCVVGGLLVAPGAVGAQEDDDDTPPVPAAYYGSVTVDGEPAEAGVDVTAAVDGTTYGPISTDDDGEFGGPAITDDKLHVEPDATPDDPEVTFFVEGEEVDTTATWESGANEQVSLSIDELPESDDGDDETDDGTDDDSDAADDSDDASGNGDDGGQAGGGEPNPPVHGDDDDADGTDAVTEAPTVEDVRSDLEQTEPDTETSTEITDADPDTPGVTVDTEDADSVEQITFGEEDATGSVDVREYQSPPESVTESVSAAVAADAAAASDDGTQEPTSASVVSVAEISPSDEATASSAATVTMTVDRDQVTDPDNAVIAHERDDSWEQLETIVRDSDEDEVTLEANVDSFSLFAVAETTASPQAESTESDETDADDDVGDDAAGETDDGIPGFGIPAALAAFLAATLLAYRRQ